MTEMDIKHVSDYIAKASKLPRIEFAWLLAWNVAAGEWQRIGLNPQAAKEFLIDIFGQLQGDLSDLSKKSAAQLQTHLMALKGGDFEEIQQEAPFIRFAQRNMEALLRAWGEGGEPGFARVWDDIFHARWEAEQKWQDPIQVVGEIGDCKERALEVVGAPDGETRVAAEWWYLYYTFGHDWNPGMHATVGGDGDSTHFSVHQIQIPPSTEKRVYFRLPW
jgi:hypothetical protein